MANVRITDLTDLGATPASGDELAIEDVSANQTKKVSITNLFGYLTGAFSELITSNLTASRALVSGSGGKVEVSSVTSTELGYLSGATSNIQNQISVFPTSPVSNLIYNGNFDLWDKGTSPTATDDTYILPGWCFLLDAAGAAPTLSQQTSSPPDGCRYYLRLAANSNCTVMLVHFLEAQDAIPLTDKTLSITVKAKGAAAAGDYLRGYILSWSSTADAVTSDVIATWPATGSDTAYTALAANWTAENAPSAQDITDSWQTFTFDGITVDTASMANIAVGIYLNITNTQSVDIAQVQCQIGSAATTFVARPVALERQLAYRRFIRWAGDASGLGPAISGYASAGSEVHKTWLPFPVQMRTTPTGTVGGTWALTNCTGPTLTNTGVNGASLTATSSAGGAFSAATNGTDDYLQFDAEL